MFSCDHCSRKGAIPNTNERSVELVQYTVEVDVNTLILLEDELSWSVFTQAYFYNDSHCFTVSKKKNLFKKWDAYLPVLLLLLKLTIST